MTTEDETRMAEARAMYLAAHGECCQCYGCVALRLLDTARVRIAQLDADYVQAQKDANVMIDEREAKVKRLEARKRDDSEGRLAAIRESAALDRSHADHVCNDVVITMEHFQANPGALHGVCHLTVTRNGAEPMRIASCFRPDADDVALLEEREFLLAKIDAAQAEVEALKRGFATPASEASTSEGTHASVPGNAWDVIIRDRDEWKRRAGKAEAFIASIGQDSGVDFHDEIAHLRGEGPDPFAVPEVERWRKRSEAAELRLSQVENTIRVAIDREGNPVGIAALCELMFDLGFELEPGR